MKLLHHWMGSDDSDMGSYNRPQCVLLSKIFKDATDEIPDPLPSLDKISQDHTVSQ